MCEQETIVAPATAPGGAIAVVRLSGAEALTVADRLFRGRRPLARAEGYTVHFGRILDGERTVDEVLATVFRAPHSYTGENAVEFSCHGSSYIVSEILRLAQAAGARMAQPGEFTIRAYLAGKLDLSQAEAVADLIASSSRSAHALAISQIRGGYSQALDGLRDKLLDLASLLELELDFSEEDVEFADRHELQTTLEQIGREIDALRNSFSLGNAIREGVPVAIAGAPNVGKSTLLNRLLHDDRAMVSEIAGTTRDVIEEQANIDGVIFRFLDTAGIRSTDDRLERMGIERTLRSIARARIVLYIVDAATIGSGIPAPEFPLREDQTMLTVVNKIDAVPGFVPPTDTIGIDTLCPTPPDSTFAISARDGIGVDALCPTPPDSVFGISARDGIGIDALCRALRNAVDTNGLFHGDAIVSNGRHFQALSDARTALDRALDGFRQLLPADLLAEEIRSVCRSLSAITGRGSIIPDEILQNIFSKFCIGK